MSDLWILQRSLFRRTARRTTARVSATRTEGGAESCDAVYVVVEVDDSVAVAVALYERVERRVAHAHTCQATHIIIIVIIFIFRKQDNTIYYQMNTFGRLPEKHMTHWLAACVTNEYLKNNIRSVTNYCRYRPRQSIANYLHTYTHLTSFLLCLSTDSKGPEVCV